MLKTQLKLAHLKKEIDSQQKREEAHKIARRKKRKADQQRARNAAKARQRAALESHQPSTLNLAQNPLRTDPDEQKRADRIRWRLETENEQEVRTLADWCGYIARESGAALTAVDLEAILRAEDGYTLSEIIRCLREAIVSD